ncbi:MAG: alpha/beta hydrolase [Pseudomonadota bacterium]|nr:alpha/beta hydrolase [Pseudomonadota bacterium]
MNEDGSYGAQSVLTATNMKVRAMCLIPSKVVIPVIFVPGIMGTRLKVKNSLKTKAWFPPEGKITGLGQVIGTMGRSAATRQRILDPNNTEVDDTGPAHAPPESAVLMGDAPGESDAERATRRGWGQLHEDSYGVILDVLEQRLSAMFRNGKEIDERWAAAVMDWQEERMKVTRAGKTSQTGAQRLGAVKPFTPIDEEALKRAASAFYPVYAVGYNWLQSNQASGKHLALEIKRIRDFYRDRNKVCDKVIVVTHSMGGLAARACAQLEEAKDMILGVVHGVMPAIGAPATYKRMRAGFEGPEQALLGRDGADATAVLANAPGPLELLPTRQYKTKDPDGVQRHWLRMTSPVTVPTPRSQGQRKSVPLGEGGDIYADIYLNNQAQSWWRLVKEELIDPAGREDREKAKKEGKKVVEGNDEQRDFKRFSKVMKLARELHDLTEDKYHPITYASYADDKNRPSWNEVRWHCARPVDGDCRSGDLLNDDLNGTVKVRAGKAEHELAIAGQEGPGDGTVPAESGAAPTPHVKQMFRHQGLAGGHTSYDHQGSYKADVVQAVTLYSIARMAADSEWLNANLHRA